MKYKVTGRLKTSEYLEFKAWQSKGLLLVPLLITIAIFVYIYGIASSWPLYYFEIYAEYLLRESSRMFVFFLFISAFAWLFITWSHSLTGYTYALKDYTFDEEGIRVRYEYGGVDLPWTKVEKVAISNVGVTINFLQKAKIYIPLRLLGSSADREAILAFIRAKTAANKEANI